MKLQSFIFIHDQDIILDFISHNKFKKLKDITYVFLGNRDSSKISTIKNVIVAKNLKFNIEEYFNLTAFTGWYALWRNNLVRGDYINLFEYDINISNNIENTIESIIKQKKIEIIGYIIGNPHHHGFLKSNFNKNLTESIKKNYKVDIINFIESLPEEKKCSMTSNHTMSKNFFFKYMSWMNVMLDDIKTSPVAGHQTERSISAFYLLYNISHEIIKDHLYHFGFNSHETTKNIDHQKQIINNYKYLLKNSIKNATKFI